MPGAQTDFLKGFEEFYRNFHPRPATPQTLAAVVPGSSHPHGSPQQKHAAAPAVSRRDIHLERRGRLLAAQLRCPKIERSLTVKWSGRLTTTAGLANYCSQRITLNPRLKEISEDEVERTFLHELAHLIAHERAGGRRIKAHGPEWRRACADLGIPGENVRHNLPFERRKLERRFQYLCTNCGKIIGRVRKMRRPAACADCCNRLNYGRFDSRFLLVEAPRSASSLNESPS